MYNGIGLQSARGSGTNGYVQTNLAHLMFSRQRVEYNADDDMERNEKEITKGPNKELLEHEYKRRIEIKCVEFEDLLEEKGFNEAEVQEKVNEYRKLLLVEFEAGRMDLEQELDDRNSHSRAHLAKVGRDRFRNAFGIDNAYKAGSSFEQMRKPGEDPVKKAEELEEAKKAATKEEELQKLRKEIEKEKERSRKLKDEKERDKKKRRREKEKKREEKERKREEKRRKRARHDSGSSDSD